MLLCVFYGSTRIIYAYINGKVMRNIRPLLILTYHIIDILSMTVEKKKHLYQLNIYIYIYIHTYTS